MDTPKYSIAGMGACIGAAEGLDMLDQMIFDGVQGFSTREVNGATLFGGFLTIEHLDDESDLNLLEKVVGDAITDTNSSLSLKDCSLILVSSKSENKISDLFKGECKDFHKFDTFAEALNATAELQNSSDSKAMVIAAIDRMNNKFLQSENLLEKEPRLQQQENPTLVFDESNPKGLLGEGAAAIVLVREPTTSAPGYSSMPRFYASIEAQALDDRGNDGQQKNLEVQANQAHIKRISQNSLSQSGIVAADVHYLEVSAGGDERIDKEELAGLMSIYGQVESDSSSPQSDSLNCAVGSAKTNFGETNHVSSLLAIVKTSLCLYHRYFPGTPAWTGPGDKAQWSGSGLYVPSDARSWFVEQETPQRNAAVSLVEGDRYSHVILSDRLSPSQRHNQYLAQVCCSVFPVLGDSESELLEKLDQLMNDIQHQDIKATALQYYQSAEQTSAKQTSAKQYAAMILGENKATIQKEIESIIKGISKAFIEQGEIKTPKGSYFTAAPLGYEAEVAFMYPGVGSSYVGLGQKIFHLFPSVYETAVTMTSSLGRVLKENRLYPRSQHLLSFKEKRKIDTDLHSDLDSIGETDTAYSVVCTKVMMDVFGVKPSIAFGYSMVRQA
ncbi:MAG: hypothetical protein JKY67_22305 [Pseudomonadales bacterium]|nr:hypothetical protein [Pseudomonadales bacterium]